MHRAIALALIVGAFLVLGSPAQAATVEEVPVYERAATKEWHWTSPWIVRVWHTRRETEAAYRKVLVIGGAATVSTYICGLVKVVVAEYVCKAAITGKTVDFLQNVTEAHRRKVCLTATINFLKAPGNVDFNDQGGARCKK